MARQYQPKYYPQPKPGTGFTWIPYLPILLETRGIWVYRLVRRTGRGMTMGSRNGSAVPAAPPGGPQEREVRARVTGCRCPLR